MMRLLNTLLLTICWLPLCADPNDPTLFEAYLAQDIDTWRKVVKQTDCSTRNDLADLVNYEYGYIGFCLARSNEAEATKTIARAHKHLETLQTMGYDDAMLNMYQSALAAFELSMNHSKFATLGVKSVKLANLAIKQAPKNPYVLSLKGNTDFYRPALFGGSKSRAIEHYTEAVRQFEAQKLTHNNWNYIATLLTLAQAYEKTDDLPKAKAVCDKILSIVPNFVYLRDVYYPALLKKIND